VKDGAAKCYWSYPDSCPICVHLYSSVADLFAHGGYRRAAAQVIHRASPKANRARSARRHSTTGRWRPGSPSPAPAAPAPRRSAGWISPALRNRIAGAFQDPSSARPGPVSASTAARSNRPNRNTDRKSGTPSARRSRPRRPARAGAHKSPGVTRHRPTEVGSPGVYDHEGQRQQGREYGRPAEEIPGACRPGARSFRASAPRPVDHADERAVVPPRGDSADQKRQDEIPVERVDQVGLRPANSFDGLSSVGAISRRARLMNNCKVFRRETAVPD